ncbi:MAG: response regulator [Deltaproteobacteria bacterium]|nr:response regulator [Deltaproteobacteria bacterium]
MGQGGTEADGGGHTIQGCCVDRQIFLELFERSADANLLLDGDRFIACNAAAVQMLRYPSREHVLDLHPSELSPERQPDGSLSYEKANDMIALAVAQGSHRFEWEHRRADGEVFPVEVLLTVVHQGGRAILHTVWRDISQRARLEGELRQAQKMKALGQLAGGVAHDFNNLLVAILGNAELLGQRVGPDDPMASCIQEIRQAGLSAAELVDQLLSYSRKQVLRAEVVDLNQVLTGMRQMLVRLIGEDIAVELRACPHALPVKVDRGQLEQVIMNLVTNARDAMPGGGRLLLSVQRAQRPRALAELRVVDSGEGIPQALIEQIFDPFFTTKETGTGLGLSTVMGIVRQSGGEVVVGAGPEGGTAFSVFLPLTDEVPGVRGDPAPQRAPRARGGERILLVEDEPRVARLIRRVLEGAGYRVQTAASGHEALALDAGGDLRFDLLLTDVIMPGMSGPELASALAVRRPGMRVLFASGYTNDALMRRGTLDEGVALLQKPFSTAQLSEAVRASLDREPGT